MTILELVGLVVVLALMVWLARPKCPVCSSRLTSAVKHTPLRVCVACDAIFSVCSSRPIGSARKFPALFGGSSDGW